MNARGAKVKILKDDEQATTPVQNATKKASQMSIASEKGGAATATTTAPAAQQEAPALANKENIPVEATGENRGPTPMQEKSTANGKPLQQVNFDMAGQEDIGDNEDIVDDCVIDDNNMPDNSAYRDKEVEELQKEKTMLQI